MFDHFAYSNNLLSKTTQFRNKEKEESKRYVTPFGIKKKEERKRHVTPFGVNFSSASTSSRVQPDFSSLTPR